MGSSHLEEIEVTPQYQRWADEAAKFFGGLDILTGIFVVYFILFFLSFFQFDFKCLQVIVCFCFFSMFMCIAFIVICTKIIYCNNVCRTIVILAVFFVWVGGERTVDAIHTADGKEYILEVNGTSSGLSPETTAEDSLHIREVTLQRMDEHFCAHFVPPPSLLARVFGGM
jgi:hypothetical protein